MSPVLGQIYASFYSRLSLSFYYPELTALRCENRKNRHEILKANDVETSDQSNDTKKTYHEVS
jgi:hypothetical protein